MPESFWDMQNNKHFATQILGKRCNILSGSARLESWHHCMPESFWDMQHKKHFGTKNLNKCCNILSESARLESWHHCMPERFWDMQRNKHFGTKNLKNVVTSYLGQPGWSPGIIVCLRASGICNIINILRQKISYKCSMSFWFSQVGVQASLYA